MRRTRFMGSDAAFSEEDSGDGFDEDEEVFEDGLAFDVADVEGDLFGEADGVAVADFEEAALAFTDLPEAGDAWGDEETAAVFRGVESDLAWERRSGADEGHFAFEDIDHLGEFVDGRLADESAYGSDTGVILHFEGDPVIFFVEGEEFLEFGFSVDAHAAEFEHAEFLAAEADAVLAEEDWAAVAADEESDDEEEGGEDDEEDGGGEEVDGAFDEGGEGDGEAPCDAFPCDVEAEAEPACGGGCGEHAAGEPFC
jgi:hypothetical protein